MADEDPVLLEVKGGVAVISLNRPDKHMSSTTPPTRCSSATSTCCAATATCGPIADRPPVVVRLIREHVQALTTGGVRSTLQRELVGQAMVLGSRDHREHREARAEGREPRYERR